MHEEGLHPCHEAVVVHCPNGPHVDLHVDAAARPTAPSVLADQDLVAGDAELAWLDSLLHDRVWLHPCPQRVHAF